MEAKKCRTGTKLTLGIIAHWLFEQDQKIKITIREGYYPKLSDKKKILFRRFKTRMATNTC